MAREIMWNVPGWAQVGMYVFFALACAVFCWGFYRRWVVYQKGVKGGLSWDQPFERLKRVLVQIGLHKKLSQRQPDGLFHAFIFYGFLMLMFVTTMVALEHDTPLHFWHGQAYLVLSFMGDLGGVLMLIGLIYFLNRRYIQKPKYIESTKTSFQGDGVMHIILMLLVVQGFFLEAFRIAVDPQPVEAWASFVGYPLALFCRHIGLNEMNVQPWHQFFWLFHMISTMAFVAVIPFTKLAHFILSLVNVYTQKLESKGALEPIPFATMENAESFGVSKLAELSTKQRMSVDTCVECGRCEMACPAFLTEKPLSPKKIVVKLRDRMWNEEIDGELKKKTFFETETFSFDEIFSCTTCGACVQECPVGIEHVSMIMDMRRYLTLTQAQIPPTAGDMVRKVQTNGNPWGISQEDRAKWSEGMNIPVAEEGVHVDYLYYIGCAGSYDDRNKKVVKATIELLKKANVKFAIIGKDEKCNGDPVRRVGDEYTFNEIAVERVTQLNKYKFTKVIAHCPHCFHTIGSEYGKFGGHYDVIHHTQLLAELIKEGRLKPTKKVEKDFVFHDPCYLGRHHGEYDAPREVLRAVPGLTLKEHPKSREKSTCCGMGGGNMWYEMKHGTSMTQTRMDQLKTESKNVASGCSYCLINFEFGRSTKESYQDMSLSDVAEILRESVES